MPLTRASFRPDGLVGFLRDGYRFGSIRFDEHGTDVWESRIGPVPIIWLRGRDGAELFYDHGRFDRQGVLPRRIRRTLTGEHTVQSLDGDDHVHRKATLMSLMSPPSLDDIERRAGLAWQLAIERWSSADRPVALTHALADVHAWAAHQWVGAPTDDDIAARAADLRALYEAPLAIGPRHWRGRASRRRLDRWAVDIVGAVRRGEVTPPPDRPLATLAVARDRRGVLLPIETAGAELINLVRPIVAVERLVCFAVTALHGHAAWAERLRADPGPERDRDVDHFIHEVRRLAPFVPAVAARVRSHFVWHDVRFPRGRLVLLDVYGTNRDPRSWTAPDAFDPDRFAGRRIGAYEFVPQGGGDPAEHHRCAGEWITVRLLRLAVDVLTHCIDYRLPPQDLSVDLRRVPAIPRSGVVVDHVRPRRDGPQPVGLRRIFDSDEAECPVTSTPARGSR